jgi:hypothetical protein
MRAACAKPADVFSLMGVYPGFTTKLPGVPGFDGEWADPASSGSGT